MYIYVHIYIYVYIYIHIYVHIYIYIYVYTYLYLYIYIYIHACMHVCMDIYIYICIHTCMYACMHGYMYVCMYVCMHACMHVCMYSNQQLTHATILYPLGPALSLPGSEVQHVLGAAARKKRLENSVRNTVDKWGLNPNTIHGCHGWGSSPRMVINGVTNGLQM